MKKIFQAFILAQVVLYSALASAIIPTPTPTPTTCTCGKGSAVADGCKQNEQCVLAGRKTCDETNDKGTSGTCQLK